MCDVVELEGRGVDWIAYAVGRVNLRHDWVELCVARDTFEERKGLDGRRVAGPLTLRKSGGEVVEYNDRVVIVRRLGTSRLPEIVIDELVAELAAEGARA